VKRVKFLWLLAVFFLYALGFGGSYLLINRNSAAAAVIMASNASVKVPTTVDSSDPREEEYLRKKEIQANEAWKNRPLSAKEVFLTFDDGPSENTLKVLDILNKNDIKATFFVIGKNAENNPKITEKLAENNMCVLPHSQTHDYDIYKKRERYMEDYRQCVVAIKELTGKTPPSFVRMPGGSDNRVSPREELQSIKQQLIKENIYYVDWNVSSGDAAAARVPKDRIIGNILGELKYTSYAVILMHDSSLKTTSVEALPEVIKYLKDKGYVFRTFDDLSIAEEKELEKLKVINR